MSNAKGTVANFRITVGKKPSPLTLSAKDILKLTFQVVDGEGGKGVQPHQTFLRFYDEVSKEEGIQPIRVSVDGKAKFELVRSFDSCARLLAKRPTEYGTTSFITSTHHNCTLESRTPSGLIHSRPS